MTPRLHRNLIIFGVASPIEDLTAAVKANDTALLFQILARYPDLKSKLDEPLASLSFDSPALIGAVNNKNREMIDALLAAGANINARTQWWAGGFGVLDVCDGELADFLIARGANVDIHAAARLGRFDRLKELIQSDPSLANARGGDGQTPLHCAATVEIAAYLLDHGAEIDTRDIDHESTAAQYMVSMRPRRLEAARYLVSRGAQTDILMAAALGDLELAKKHIDSIHICVSGEDFPKQNPRAGGCIYIFGFGWGRTPHMLAHEFGHEDVFRFLMQHSPLELQLTQACDVGDEALALELAAKKPTLSRESERRLISAAMRNDIKALRLMLHLGWPVDVQNDNAQTALHWAAFHGNAEMLRELLKQGAPLNVHEEEHGGTPLDWALYGSKHGWHIATGDYPQAINLLTEAAN